MLITVVRCWAVPKRAAQHVPVPGHGDMARNEPQITRKQAGGGGGAEKPVTGYRSKIRGAEGGVSVSLGDSRGGGVCRTRSLDSSLAGWTQNTAKENTNVKYSTYREWWWPAGDQTVRTQSGGALGFLSKKAAGGTGAQASDRVKSNAGAGKG